MGGYAGNPQVEPCIGENMFCGDHLCMKEGGREGVRMDMLPLLKFKSVKYK